jgi:hypothetical protein
MATAFTLTDGTFRSSRHTTHYWGAGSVDGPLIWRFICADRLRGLCPKRGC